MEPWGAPPSLGSPQKGTILASFRGTARGKTSKRGKSGVPPPASGRRFGRKSVEARNSREIAGFWGSPGDALADFLNYRTLRDFIVSMIQNQTFWFCLIPGKGYVLHSG